MNLIFICLRGLASSAGEVLFQVGRNRSVTLLIQLPFAMHATPNHSKSTINRIAASNSPKWSNINAIMRGMLVVPEISRDFW